MRKFTLISLTSLALASLAACSSAPEKVNPNAESVTFSFDGNDLKEVTQTATQHCNQYTKAPKLRSVSEVDGKTVAIYDCV
jgi:outer membrane biogenesis lipoprotein LolB